MRKKNGFLMRVAALAVAGMVTLGGVPAQVNADEVTESQQETDVYVLMNVPYNDFYAAELGTSNDVSVDGVSSATKTKPRSGSLVGGSYHVSSDGSDITGVTIPVKLGEGVSLGDLKVYTEVTDANTLDITVTNRGQTSTTTYTGKEALFESANYSYYVLSETPSSYKVVTKDESGNLVFGEMQGTSTEKSDVTASLLTSSNYGDYQLTLTGLDQINSLYGVVIETQDGTKYGLRHLENIWRTSNLAWSTGFTTTTHGNTLNPEHYVSIMGKTIKTITYYTADGKLVIPVDIYVPVKFDGSVTVADAAASAGSTDVKVEGLPTDFAAKYTVEGLDQASVTEGVLTYSKDAAVGSYTLKVSDGSSKYVDITASFTLTTDSVPVSFDQNTKALVAAEGFSADDVTAYVKNITSVEVDGTSYSVSGRDAVTIINADGTLKQDAAPIAESGKTYSITVKSTGYTKDLTFSYITEAPSVQEPEKDDESKKDDTTNKDTSNNTSSTTNTTTTTNTSTTTNAQQQTAATADQVVIKNDAVVGNETAAAAQKAAVKKGDTYTKNKVTYQVTSTADGKSTVKVTGIKSKNLTEVTIPATVSIEGKTYKVTSISKNAFADCSKLTKITIGKNVTSIGKGAFSGCSNLKTITIKSKVLNKVSANAFKGIKSSATIKVPSSKVKAYTALLKGKGQGKKVTITK